MLRRKIHLIVLLLALLIPAAVVLAADSIILGDNHYQVDLVSNEDNGDGTNTFTYAVTGLNPPNALSHWTLGIDTCLDSLVSPTGNSYTTVTSIPQCGDGTYDCEVSHYSVETGNDATLGINGIKFQDASPQLTAGKTHVFQITVEDLGVVDLIEVGGKYAGNEPTDVIDGPVCGGQTAISLSSTEAGSTTVDAFLPMAIVVLGLAAASFVVWRRQAAAA